MQTIVTEYCKKCGSKRRVYNKKKTYYYGAQVCKCKKCGSLYLDHHAIELSTCSDKYLKSACKDYMIDGYNFLCLVIMVGVFSIVEAFTSETYINSGVMPLLLVLLGFGIPFVIKCLIKRYLFWNIIYKESVERMRDEKYLALLEEYNRELKSKQV